jgi:hypothetical protein
MTHPADLNNLPLRKASLLLIQNQGDGELSPDMAMGNYVVGKNRKSSKKRKMPMGSRYLFGSWLFKAILDYYCGKQVFWRIFPVNCVSLAVVLVVLAMVFARGLNLATMATS